jgi:hypothetical protein
MADCIKTLVDVGHRGPAIPGLRRNGLCRGRPGTQGGRWRSCKSDEEEQQGGHQIDTLDLAGRQASVLG